MTFDNASARLPRNDPALKLLLWYWGRRGGPVTMTHHLALALNSRPDVRLSLSLSRQSELFEETAGLGIPGCHVDTYTGALSALAGSVRLPGLNRQIDRFCREHDVQVVLCMMRHLWGRFSLPVARRAGARVLMMLHDATPHPGESYPLWHRQLASDLAVTDGLVVLSDHVRDAVIQSYGYPTDRIWTVPHMVMPFSPPPPQPRRLPEDRPVRLMFFGRILEYKGLDILADAWSRLAGRLPLELHVVGNGSVPALDRLRALPDVRLDLRWIPEAEIGGILEQADILVAPYREASQSGVVPAACALGLPVVATPVGGLVEQVRHGETGLIAPAVTGAAVADTVARFLSEPELYTRCSAGALAVSQAEIGIASVAESLCAAARELGRMPPRRGSGI
jgi:glycosyltransferase involved in cell wall biosynthesis